MIIATRDGNVNAYEGKVIATRHENLGQDSHFYAYVWEDGKIVEIEDGSTSYGGPARTARVDMTVDIKDAVVQSLISDIKDALKGNHYMDVSPKVGSRVKSLTTRGKAYGVVGEIVGEGSGNHGPFFRVKDDATNRIVIVSQNRVALVNNGTGVLDKECLALHVALTLVGKSGKGVLIDAYAQAKGRDNAMSHYGGRDSLAKSYAYNLVKDAGESMARNLVDYDSHTELMEDFRQDGNALAFIIARRLIAE